MTMLEERSTMTTTTPVDKPIPVTRRRIDHLLIGAGLLAAVVLTIAGGLLTWGSNFSRDYVSDELAAQNITFPPPAARLQEGREDLAKFGAEQVDPATAPRSEETRVGKTTVSECGSRCEPYLEKKKNLK